MTAPVRHRVIVLGDQLDARSSAFDGFDPARDTVWMAEVAEESTHVPSSRMRIAVFLSGMRHFAEALRTRGWTVEYRRLSDAPGPPGEAKSLAEALRQDEDARPSERLVVCEPGEHRVAESLRATARSLGRPIEIRSDRHFLCSTAEFAAHARGKRQLRLETFYRAERQRHRVLMEGDEPAGGRWNFDEDNRESFGREGPGFVPPPRRFAPDAITREVIELVERRFAGHPGSAVDFGWPMTRDEAQVALRSFIEERLPDYGRWQDAMWTGEPWLYHSHLSAALNLKLLDPREVIDAAQAAWQAGRAPLAAVEGFIRQILGWREYVRGVYWLHMPGYAEQNALGADQPLPDWYWNGRTDMACLREAVGQTLRLGYAHHIQRLMVTGLFALLYGVAPREIHAWYLSVYVDAAEWVELPNVLGMSQYADGGAMSSKPYAATGQYIERMSDHCRGCRYRPRERTGPSACPFTTLYWDFLLRHEARFAKHPRMALQVKNLARLAAPERAAIGARADAIRRGEVGRA